MLLECIVHEKILDLAKSTDTVDAPPSYLAPRSLSQRRSTLSGVALFPYLPHGAREIPNTVPLASDIAPPGRDATPFGIRWRATGSEPVVRGDGDEPARPHAAVLAIPDPQPLYRRIVISVAQPACIDSIG